MTGCRLSRRVLAVGLLAAALWQTAYGQAAGAAGALPTDFSGGATPKPAAAPAAPAAAAPAPPATDATPAVAPAPAADAGPLSVDEISARQQADRQGKELQADKLFLEGQDAFMLGNYELAKTKLIEAEAKYGQISKDHPRITGKAEQVKKLLAKTFKRWGDQLIREAQAAEAVGSKDKFDEAVRKYEQARLTDPEIAAEVNARLRTLADQREFAEFRRKTSDAEVDPEYIKRRKEVAELLEQGNVFTAHRNYMRARERFEQVLVKDPYNIEATRNLRQLYDDLREDGKQRRWAMLRERMAEIEWKWIDPIPPLEVTPENQTLVQPVPTETRRIEEKLKTIRLPNISFQDATISNVIQHLRERSKALDPDNEGINIFLMLDPGAGTETGAAAPAAAPAAAAKPAAAGGEFSFADFDTNKAAAPAAAAEASKAHEPTVTMEFDNIPLGEAIRYICQGAALHYRVEPHAVIVAHPSIALDKLETRFFSVSPSLLAVKRTRTSPSGFEGSTSSTSGGGSTAVEDVGDLRTNFTQYGIDFPEGASIRYEARVSKLIVTNTPENLRKIEQILNELIEAPLQVTIEAKFIEVRQNHLDELSFQWLFMGQATTDVTGNRSTRDWHQSYGDVGDVRVQSQDPANTGTNSSALLSRTTRNVSGSPGAILGIDTIIGGLQFNTMMAWYDRTDGGDLLSAPKVTTVSGQTAVIRMVEQRQFADSFTDPEFSTSDGVTSYTPPTPEFGESRDIGVILTVTPTIDAGDKYTIDLDLSPEVLEFIKYDTSYNTIAIINGQQVELRFDTPIIEQRSVETRVNVWDGETVVLGGTIRDSIQKNHDRIPVLADIPVVGRLFRSDGEYTEKKNLLIFVTARIVNPAGLPIRRQDVRGLPDFRR